MTSFTLPYWYDLHTHLRQEELLRPIVRSQLEMGCAGVLAMPNTKPPVAKVSKVDAGVHSSIDGYLAHIRAVGGDMFSDIIVPLYLTKETSVAMIADGAASGLLRAAKYYPPHGTTGADFGYPFSNFMENGVFAAMEKHGVVLCIHGEEHGLQGADYFDETSNAEDVFYSTQMPQLIEKFPDLKVACEHVTTKTAVDFVLSAGDAVAASITPQHLLYTVGDLLQGCKYHLYCLPLLKFSKDRDALRAAVTDAGNTKFYAGTDSAAHTVKATPCGCAAGCFTGGIAPQLYAQAFEEAGVDLGSDDGQAALRRFLCENGVAFYGLTPSEKRFTLSKEPQAVAVIETEAGDITPLPVGLGQSEIPWSLKL